MRSIEKLIYESLDRYYEKDIEFLKSDDPFEFFVMVILSQSSTDKRAMENAKLLFERYKGAKELCRADESEIERIIYSSGLSKAKAKTIKRVSQLEATSSLPRTLEGLTEIEGIGIKSASCYLYRAFGEDVVIVDTHFFRVATRLGLTDGLSREKCLNDIKRAFPKEYWSRLSMTVNKHGRMICRKKPLCNECFLSGLCSYNAGSDIALSTLQNEPS